MMQVSDSYAYTIIYACCNYTSQTIVSVVNGCSAIRLDLEAFQKAGLAALAALKSINYHFNQNYLPRLISVLESTGAIDFYSWLRLPRKCLHTYIINRFDGERLLDQLEDILCRHYNNGIEDETGIRRDAQNRLLAIEQLNELFATLTELDIVFSNEEDVKRIIENWFRRLPPEGVGINLDLSNLHIHLTETSLVDYLITYSFAIVDLACIPSFLQQWDLIDLSYYADKIGQLPFFSWVPDHFLEDWIWGALFFGYFMLTVQAAHTLLYEDISPEEAANARWVIVSSIAESLYSASIVLRMDEILINDLAFIAKSLGELAFLATTTIPFFQEFEEIVLA